MLYMGSLKKKLKLHLKVFTYYSLSPQGISHKILFGWRRSLYDLGGKSHNAFLSSLGGFILYSYTLT